jgi:hypothetical protein
MQLILLRTLEANVCMLNSACLSTSSLRIYLTAQDAARYSNVAWTAAARRIVDCARISRTPQIVSNAHGEQTPEKFLLIKPSCVQQLVSNVHWIIQTPETFHLTEPFWACLDRPFFN